MRILFGIKNWLVVKSSHAQERDKAGATSISFTICVSYNYFSANAFMSMSLSRKAHVSCHEKIQNSHRPVKYLIIKANHFVDIDWWLEHRLRWRSRNMLKSYASREYSRH